MDRSSFIESQSLNVRNMLTTQVDTANFSFKMPSDSTFDVNIGDNIKIYDTDQLIFQGKVTKLNRMAMSAALLKISVTCVDYTRELDNKVVAQTYTNQTAEDIIQDIINRYAPQFTSNHVSAPITIDFIRFSYQVVSECFQELADMTGYDWFVDQYKDIHFGLASDEPAPFDLLDDNGSYLMGSLNIDDDISQLRNSIYLRGGDEISLAQTYTEVADGDKTTFPVAYHFYLIPTVTINGISKTVGTLGTDDETLFDCMWDPNLDFIQFLVAPLIDDLLEVTGQPLNPILLYLPERNSIALYGERQFVIIDKTITTRAGARQRALAEILKYAASVTSVRFVTLTAGLRAGQMMHLNSALFGIEGDYIVTQVTTTMRTPTEYQYQITLISTKLKDIIDLLAEMLTSKLKEQNYDDSEVFDPTEVVFEDLTLTDSVTTKVGSDASFAESMTVSDAFSKPGAGGTGLNFAPVFVFGPQIPAVKKRQFNFDRSPLA